MELVTASTAHNSTRYASTASMRRYSQILLTASPTKTTSRRSLLIVNRSRLNTCSAVRGKSRNCLFRGAEHPEDFIHACQLKHACHGAAGAAEHQVSVAADCLEAGNQRSQSARIDERDGFQVEYDRPVSFIDVVNQLMLETRGHVGYDSAVQDLRHEHITHLGMFKSHLLFSSLFTNALDLQLVG